MKTLCGLVVAVLVLSGCGGGGSGSSSAASVSSSPPSAPTSSGGSSSSPPPTTPPTSGGSSPPPSGGGSTPPPPPPSPPPPTTGSAKLTWTAPTVNSDGSALTGLAGYHIYYGTTAGSLTNTVDIANPATLTYVVANLQAGTWYFAVTAYTNSGIESSDSNVGKKTIT
jgi:hypothetical protein